MSQYTVLTYALQGSMQQLETDVRQLDQRVFLVQHIRRLSWLSAWGGQGVPGSNGSVESIIWRGIRPVADGTRVIGHAGSQVLTLPLFDGSTFFGWCGMFGSFGSGSGPRPSRCLLIDSCGSGALSGMMVTLVFGAVAAVYKTRCTVHALSSGMLLSTYSGMLSLRRRRTVNGATSVSAELLGARTIAR